MKAAIVKAADVAPEYGDFTEPIVGEGCELVELVAAGIHNVVRSLADGRHYGSAGKWPHVPGVDAVARTPAGDLVYTGFIQPPYGTLADRMAAPVAVRFPLPSGATQVVGLGRNPAGLQRAARLGAKTVTLTGERVADAAALGGAAPSIFLDFLWAAAAETAFAALGRRGFEEDTANIAYVQIGAMAGPEAAVPASLLRSRHIRISGSGAGSASIADVMAQVPVYIQLIADRKVDVPTRTYPLSSISQAWTAPEDSTHRTVIVPG